MPRRPRGDGGSSISGYDIIGDIHGEVGALRALLAELGYVAHDGVYRHDGRRVIFVGDFIDRGPGQREVLDIARTMVDAGSALAVMGNHEFNALGWATRDLVDGGYLREHSTKHRLQHDGFLRAFDGDHAAYRQALDWFWSLPLWLDLGDLRVVHACWDRASVDRLSHHCAEGNRLTPRLLEAGSRKGNWEFRALETLLKGKEIPLPDGISFHDKEGIERRNIRVRWWDGGSTTYREAFMGPDSARTHIPDDRITGNHLLEYHRDAPPVFLGHYWLEGEPAPLAGNIACLDYSVARPGGRLVAYRWSGERMLTTANFVSVTRPA